MKILKDGGWHFTRVISPEEIHKKELDAENEEFRIKAIEALGKLKYAGSSNSIKHILLPQN